MATSTGIFCKVKELEPGDKIAAGTSLGFIKTTDVLTVKKTEEAAKDFIAVTLYRCGTLFINKDLLVELED